MILSGMCLLVPILFYLLFPETAGRRLEEITSDDLEAEIVPDKSPNNMVDVAMATSKWFEAPIMNNRHAAPW